MKTAKLLAACMLTLLGSHIYAQQWVNIPDTIFGNWLYNNGISPCMMGNSTSGWYIDINCHAVKMPNNFNLGGLGISDLEGIQYFDSLYTLDCSNNNLDFISALPPLLAFFNCSNQNSNFFRTQFPTLNLPDGLLSLNCSYNSIYDSLPALPAGLDTLICTNNSLRALPALPAGLKVAELQDNDLRSMPPLPTGLTYLNVSNNYSLDTLPIVLPASLQYLNCSWIGLSWLPPLPQGLVTLNCNINALTFLPPLPASLRYLECGSNNQLTTLPPLPLQLLELKCPFAGLTSLPELPDSLSILDISNTFLTCLPTLKKIREFYFNAPFITCLPNYPQSNVVSVPALNTKPLCTFYNTTGCLVTGNISGTLYADSNSNCQFNPGETTYRNIKIKLYSGTVLLQQTYTDENGFYFFNAYNNGTYRIVVDTVNIPLQFVCPANGTLTTNISAADSISTDNDFAIACTNGYDLEARSVSTHNIVRPAEYNHLQVKAGNTGALYGLYCIAIPGTVTLSFTGPVKYKYPVSGALTPTVAGNTLTWTVADFNAINFNQDFAVNMQVDTTAVPGQQVCYTLTISAGPGTDSNPANNTFSICYTVVASCDPNDKQAYPPGNIDTAQKELVYIIRFQNTGTADAQHIYITDTLSSSIDPGSFQLLGYSHQPIVQIDGNAIRFNYPYINLPDSTTNEPASHGYVQFKVKLNSGLPVGTVINNTAYIYFDFNAPVVTNTATNTIYVPVPPVLKPVTIGKPRIQRAVLPNGKL